MCKQCIEVKTFATLRALYPPEDHFPLKPGMTVADVMKEKGIPAHKVTIIFINNVHADEDSPLSAGDVLGLFPPIGGG